MPCVPTATRVSSFFFPLFFAYVAFSENFHTIKGFLFVWKVRLARFPLPRTVFFSTFVITGWISYISAYVRI